MMWGVFDLIGTIVFLGFMFIGVPLAIYTVLVLLFWLLSLSYLTFLFISDAVCTVVKKVFGS